MNNNLLVEDEIRSIAEIDYEKDDVLILQRQGALAVNELVATFIDLGQVLDNQLIALALVRFKDLQVRDYAMGLANNENKDKKDEFMSRLDSLLSKFNYKITSNKNNEKLLGDMSCWFNEKGNMVCLDQNELPKYFKNVDDVTHRQAIFVKMGCLLIEFSNYGKASF